MPYADHRHAAPGFTVWLTGLPGAGKSTLAAALRQRLSTRGHPVEVLDGDEVRASLSRDLGFTRADRDTNVGRMGFVARLLARNGVAVIVAAVSPYRDARDAVRQAHESPFLEVFVDCSRDELERRDPKGLYARARAGTLQGLTGVSAPYEPPSAPEVHVETHVLDLAGALDMVDTALVQRHLTALAQPVASPAVPRS